MSTYVSTLPVSGVMPGGGYGGGGDMDPRVEKFLKLLVSRKFWLMVVGLLVALGILDASEAESAELVGALVTVFAFGLGALGIAVEDGLSRSGGL